MEDPRPIMIAGAGIAGLTLAASLIYLGREIQLIERGEGLASTGAGISLWPNALAALDAIQLGDAVRIAGGSVPSGGVRRPDGSWMRKTLPSIVEAALGEPMVAIHRTDLLETLASTVDASSSRFGASLTSFQMIDTGVRAILDDGSELEGCALVGADGIGSVVTKALAPDLRSRYSGYTAWRGIAAWDISGMEPGETWGRGHEFGFVPIGPGQTYWFATENTPEGGRSPEGELDHLLGHFGRWHAPIPDLLGATEESAVLRHDIYDRVPLRSWSRGPVVAIGDAAHPMRPHLGQGGCQAIEDGVLLACAIAATSDLPTAFAEFSRRRDRRIRPIIRQSAVIGKVVQGEGSSSSVLREIGTRIPMRLLIRSLSRVGGRASFTSEWARASAPGGVEPWQ